MTWEEAIWSVLEDIAQFLFVVFLVLPFFILFTIFLILAVDVDKTKPKE